MMSLSLRYNILNSLFALCAGMILVLSFAPFNLAILAYLCPAVFLYTCYRSTSIPIAFLYGLLFGCGFFGAGIYWIYISVHEFGGASVSLALFISTLLVTFLSLFPAAAACALHLLYRYRSATLVGLAGFPVIWILSEWLRELPFNGFPWLYLGYSQLHTPLHGYAPWFGIYGVSLMTSVISGALLVIMVLPVQRSKKAACGVLILSVIVLGWLLSLPKWTQPAASTFKASLVQGNIEQTFKWEPQQLTTTLQQYAQLTRKRLTSALIVWPEAAIPVLPKQVNDFMNGLDTVFKQHGSNLIVGVPLVNQQQQYFNGLLLMGQDHGQYAKRHLVPFGEYTPLSFFFHGLIQRLNIPMSDFSAGTRQQALLQIQHHIRISPFICYEIAFPSEVLHAVQNSHLLLVISDDSWFGHSIALAQHLQIAQMRALETGRYLLLATNTGITAFIGPYGQLLSVAPRSQAIVLSHRVVPLQGRTPLMRWDYYPVQFFCLLLLLLVILGPRQTQKTS